MNSLNASPSHPEPIDQLVISQMQAIIDCEMRLKERYGSLLNAASSVESERLACEVWNLRLRTDRLARMLDALDGKYVPDGLPEKNTPAAA